MVLGLLPRSRWPALATPSAAAAFVEHYPSELRLALTRLASVDPEAERTARRRLASDLPAEDDLLREITALRARLGSSGGIAQRLANLERRLAAPRGLSPRRLARLAEKLEKTATAVAIERFDAATAARVTERLVRAFGLERWPGWRLDRRLQSILVGLLRLGEADRALGGRLLRARAGNPPWNLYDDPANRSFLERLRASGVDPAPWLDDAPRRVTAGHATLELALCADPLEVFAMGAHFDTCLAPAGGNFFSVLANAADVNKRVLYARRAGRVVGRCLLALTDTYALLVFHPYCHERIDFGAAVRDFAVELAARMGTAVAPRGTVSTLLARDWYDDGPRDLVGRFPSLDGVRAAIRNLDLDALLPLLRAALGDRLDDVTLPFVLALPELQARPEVVAPLAPSLLALSTPTTRVAAAELALRAGDAALADRLLGDHDTIPLEHHAWPRGEIFARLRRSQTVARLRASRPPGVRRLGNERGDRLAVAAAALGALHRRRQAAALYRLAIEKDDYLVTISSRGSVRSTRHHAEGGMTLL